MSYFKHEDGKVSVTLSSDDFDRLLICLGFAGGAANAKGDADLFRMTLRVANAINEGHPDYTPYELRESKPS